MPQISAVLKESSSTPRINGGWSIKPADLSVVGGCVLVRDRLWIPPMLVDQAVDILHIGHKGVNMMMVRAAHGCCYWPGM
jgi:hypothetical protein